MDAAASDAPTAPPARLVAHVARLKAGTLAEIHDWGINRARCIY